MRKFMYGIDGTGMYGHMLLYGMVYICSYMEQKCIDCKQLPWLHNVLTDMLEFEVQLVID